METEIKQTKNKKTKKAVINVLLNTVKFLLFFKKVIDLIFNLIMKFLGFVFRSALKPLLIRVYYWIFRFKKDGLIEKSVFDIFRKKLPHFLIILLVTISFITNLGQPSKISAVTENMSKTTIAQLVSDEFTTYEQEKMIEETFDPLSVGSYGNDKYAHESGVLSNETPIVDEQIIGSEDQFVVEKNGDFVDKPYLWENTANDNTETSNSNKRNSVITHIVENGETVSSIAHKFDLNVNSILWANNLSERSLIRPGDKLTILPQNGILYTVVKGDTVGKIARNYGVAENAIINGNNLGNSIGIGQKIIIPGASILAKKAPTQASANNNYTGLSIIKDLVKPPASKATGAGMAWPTTGHRITQYYSWRHTGLDIADKVGTPLYATDSGTVVISQYGYNGGYGNTIVIDHGNGIRTRYAHASKLFVSVGEKVSKGETIAAMGSTGNSTGSHIHFEVIINGAKYNPLNYIK